MGGGGYITLDQYKILNAVYVNIILQYKKEAEREKRQEEENTLIFMFIGRICASIGAEHALHSDQYISFVYV